jgi:hypothetical protein
MRGLLLEKQRTKYRKKAPSPANSKPGSTTEEKKEENSSADVADFADEKRVRQKGKEAERQIIRR